MTLEEIDSRIHELKEQRKQLKGSPTEVYSRIVGYYRSLNNWNRGKREEYDYRIYYNTDYAVGEENRERPELAQGELKLEDQGDLQARVGGYLFFYRQRCPNCPPMKKALEDLPFEGTHIDADSEEGYRMAEEYSIMTTPTVILTDPRGEELLRETRPSGLSRFSEESITA